MDTEEADMEDMEEDMVDMEVVVITEAGAVTMVHTVETNMVILAEMTEEATRLMDNTTVVYVSAWIEPDYLLI